MSNQPGRAEMLVNLQSGFRSFIIRSQMWETAAICTPAIADRITNLSAPYFEVSEGEPGLPEHWTVAAPEALKNPLPEKLETVVPRGEVESTLVISAHERIIHCLSPAEDAWVAQNILRYTRALHRLNGVSNGMVLLSAAFVEVGGGGIALVGGSRAGKTSLTMALAASGNGSLISNDDLGLKIKDAQVVGYGSPRSTSVRLDTLDLLFDDSVRSGLTRQLEHPANATLPRLKTEGIEPQGTILLYPFELQKRLGFNILPSRQVNALVFPRLEDDISEPIFRRLSEGEAAARLAEFHFRIPAQHADFIPRDQFAAAFSADATLEDVAAKIPAYAFAFTFGRLRSDAEQLARALRENAG
jgi:hypothetical protein